MKRTNQLSTNHEQILKNIGRGFIKLSALKTMILHERLADMTDEELQQRIAYLERQLGLLESFTNDGLEFNTMTLQKPIEEMTDEELEQKINYLKRQLDL